MKFKTVRFLVLFSSISLLGLILMQVYWIGNGIGLAEEQYDHKVSLVLRDVIKQVEANNSQIPDTLKSCSYFSCSKQTLKNEIIQTDILEGLLKENFRINSLDTLFTFAILKSSNNSVLYHSNEAILQDIPTTCHKTGLTCIKEANCYYLKVYFPKKRSFVLIKMALWLSLSLIFLLVVIYSFVMIVVTMIRQKKVSEMKNDFINNMTHEFKTPITTISMASEVLISQDEKNERQKKYGEIIFRENKRLLSMVESLLKISELEKDKYQLNKSNVSIHEIITELIETSFSEKYNKLVQIQTNFCSDSSLIEADQLHIRNVFNNLLDNAIKYSGENTLIKISTFKKNNVLNILFEDNGIGIKKTQQKYIFEKFYRIPTGNIHNVKGFGLGLFYVKSIILLHGGNITVESNYGNGSVFTISLPLQID